MHQTRLQEEIANAVKRAVNDNTDVRFAWARLMGALSVLTDKPQSEFPTWTEVEAARAADQVTK